jgi:hypothetical protein
MRTSFLLGHLLTVAGFSLIAHATRKEASGCRNMPGDENWPSIEEWQALNSSVSGRLIKTMPAGHVCHDPTYNASACEALNATWIYPWGQYVL